MSGATCLRCGADAAWLQGTVPKECCNHSDEIEMLRDANNGLVIELAQKRSTLDATTARADELRGLLGEARELIYRYTSSLAIRRLRTDEFVAMTEKIDAALLARIDTATGAAP